MPNISRNTTAGALTLSIGLATAIYSLAKYKVGSPGHMGPGMFPLALACILVLLGIGVMIGAELEPHEPDRPAILPLFAVLGGISAFALTVESFGLVVSIYLMTTIAAFADRRLKAMAVVLLGTILSVAAVLVFRVGFGLPIPLFRWPL